MIMMDVPQISFQRIAAGAIHSGTTDNIGLKGFGRSLGTGHDLDDNGYNGTFIHTFSPKNIPVTFYSTID